MPFRYPSKTVKLPFNAPHLSSPSSTDDAGFLKTKRTYTTSQIEQTICGICGKRQSKYVCPRCNIFYCSLDCFRDEKHQQCSEPFYATAIREAIKSDSASSSEEKRKMMEMLARFERGETEGGDGSGANGLEELLKGMGGLEGGMSEVVEEGAEEEGLEELEALIQRLGTGGDTGHADNMDLQEILDLLPPSHRDKFMSLVSDPDSEQVQHLLGSLEETERKEVEGGSVPWFMVDDDDDKDRENEDRDRGDAASPHHDAKPRSVPDDVTNGIVVDPVVGVRLLYNTLAICLAYVQVLITQALPSLDHTWTRQDHSDLNRRIEIISDRISSLLPFLGDAKSMVRYASIREVWEDIWMRIGERDSAQTAVLNGIPDSSGASATQLIIILEQVRKLLVPSLDLSEERQHGVELALSDLHNFCSKSVARLSGKATALDDGKDTRKQRVPDASTRRRQKSLAGSAKKLAFYIAAVQAVRRQSGRRIWLELSAAVGREIERLRSEAEGEVGASNQEGLAHASRVKRMDGLANVARDRSGPATTGTAPTARMEEL